MVKKIKFLIALSLILLMGAMYYSRSQRALRKKLADVEIEVIEEIKDKDIAHTELCFQKAVNDKRKSKIRLIISIIWVCLMIWMITTSVPLFFWIVWFGIGFLNTFFGIIHHIKRMKKIS